MGFDVVLCDLRPVSANSPLQVSFMTCQIFSLSAHSQPHAEVSRQDYCNQAGKQL